MASEQDPLSLLCAGTSHHVAPVAFLEAAMRRCAALRALFRHAVAEQQSLPPFAELAVLATCNRVEVYALCASAVLPDAQRVLEQTLSGDDVAQGAGAHVYLHHGEAAARHLCRVTAGLESLVVGEPEIAGQVARAFDDVLHRNGGPPRLAAIARSARIAGRRARAETGISRKPASVSTVAVHLAAERVNGLAGRRVLVVGAGRMGALTAEALASRHAVITIANRTHERAAALAARIDARVAPLAELPALLAAAEVVFTAAASDAPLITHDTLAAAARVGGAAALPLLVDIAVPRNIDTAAAAAAGLQLLGINDLRSRVAAHIDERRDEAPRVETIIEEELKALEQNHTVMLPLIGDLHRRAELIRRRELERALRGLDRLDEEARARVEHLSRSLITQLLHEATTRLRAAEGERAADYARVVRDLFALDDAPPPPATPS